MKSSVLMLLAIGSLLVALAVPFRLVAQNNQEHMHHRYKLIDLGTFGGPASAVINEIFPGYVHVLNNRGSVIGTADLPTPDPYPGFCFDDDCFVGHAFVGRSMLKADLGVLPGGASSSPFWISANGLIAGVSQNGQIDPLFPGFPELRAVLWKGRQIIDLGTLDGGYESIATSVNNRGQVVGLAVNTIQDANSMIGLDSQTRAFRWENGAMQDLGTLGGPDALAISVNERGQVIGDSYTSSDQSASCAFPLATGAFFWETGRMVNVGSLGGTCTLAFALNHRGQVVGQSNLAGDSGSHPFLWGNGVLTDLGTFGGTFGYANSLNDAGYVVGAASDANEIVHAFLWRRDRLLDLGAVAGDTYSFGVDINARGQVVGNSFNSDFSDGRAFLWESGGPAVDLNTLITPGSALHLLLTATINDRGEIAGQGVLANGDAHAFVLIPCDENHPNLAGCGYGPVDETTSARGNSTGVATLPTTARGNNFCFKWRNQFCHDLTHRYPASFNQWNVRQ